jgi:hypothetical protein
MWPVIRARRASSISVWLSTRGQRRLPRMVQPQERKAAAMCRGRGSRERLSKINHLASCGQCGWARSWRPSCDSAQLTGKINLQSPWWTKRYSLSNITISLLRRSIHSVSSTIAIWFWFEASCYMGRPKQRVISYSSDLVCWDGLVGACHSFGSVHIQNFHKFGSKSCMLGYPYIWLVCLVSSEYIQNLTNF